MKKNYSLPSLFFLAILFFIASWILSLYSSKSLNSITEQAEDRVAKREQISQKAFQELDSTIFTDQALNLTSYFSSERLAIYVWKNDSMYFGTILNSQ